jgi:hypothetical protein
MFLKELVLRPNRTLWGQFLREIYPLKQMTPKYDAASGIIAGELFNGVNVEQTRYYNHIHCATYIEKIVSHHGWVNLNIRSPPMPMQSDSKYQADIQTSRGPESIKEQKELEKRMRFSYRQTIGELIYALTACQIDISIVVITLSQHSHHPAQIHYEAVEQVFAYLTAFVLWP